METVLEGLVFGESARWHGGRWWLCDWGTGDVLRAGADGSREVVLRVDSYPLCIDWLPDGRLLAVAGGEGRVLRREPDGSVVTHGDLGPLSRERWNEIAVAADGVAFVDGGPGMIASIRPDGAVRPAAGGLEFPNGLLVTPDGSALIVAESRGHRLTAFDVTAEGGLTNRRVWAGLGDDAPDGICLDAEGAIWYADVPHRYCRRVREGGAVLETVPLDRGCFSCALSGGARPKLCIVAQEWRGMQHPFDGPRSGIAVAADAPAPGVRA